MHRNALPRSALNDRRVYQVTRAIRAIFLVSLTACAAHGARHPMDTGPDVVAGEVVSSVALLGTLHVSDSVRVLADSLLDQRLRAACPSVTVLGAAESERRLAERGVVPPRQLTAAFARAAREALNVDLLLAPMALGLTYDTRNTVAGVLDAIGRPVAYMDDDRAGIALEGWDLRTAERTVRVVRTHSSERSWTTSPEQLLLNATRDAVRRLAPQCVAASSASAGAAAPPTRGTKD